MYIICKYHINVDPLNPDDMKFLLKHEVDVKKDEIEMIEKNFKIAYWPWELTTVFRKQITVCNMIYGTYT